VGDPIFPLLGNSGYDVQHYTLDLTVDATRNLLKGTATLLQSEATQPLAQRSTSTCSAWTSVAVTVDDAPALFARSGHELTITPTVPIAAGALFTTTVAYSGHAYATGRPRSGLYQPGLEPSRRETVFVVSEPGGAMTWYPVNNHPTDKATYTLPHHCGRTQRRRGQRRAGRGDRPRRDQRTYVWEMAQPMASYLSDAG
jgi:aminopeptidase N